MMLSAGRMLGAGAGAGVGCVVGECRPPLVVPLPPSREVTIPLLVLPGRDGFIFVHPFSFFSLLQTNEFLCSFFLAFLLY